MTYIISGGASGVGASVASKLIDLGREVIILDVVEPCKTLINSNLAHWINIDLTMPNYDILLSFLDKKKKLPKKILKYLFLIYPTQSLLHTFIMA